jgi:hypothetical protein
MLVTRIACISSLLLATACGGGSSTAPDTTPDETVSNTVSTDTATTGADILPPTERTDTMIASDIWQAIADNDVDLAVAYSPAIEVVGEACPEMWANPEARVEIEREMGDMEAAIAEGFAECRELLDFGAHDSPQAKWDRINDNDDCSGLESFSNGILSADTAAGRVELKVQVIKLRDGRVYLGDAPRCWLDEGDGFGGP